MLHYPLPARSGRPAARVHLDLMAKKLCPKTVSVSCCLGKDHEGSCAPTKPTSAPGVRSAPEYDRIELTITPPAEPSDDPQYALDRDRILSEIAWGAKAAVRYLETRHNCKFDVVLNGKAFPTRLPGE